MGHEGAERPNHLVVSSPVKPKHSIDQLLELVRTMTKNTTENSIESLSKLGKVTRKTISNVIWESI